MPIATHADGTLVAPAGTFPSSAPAAAGETVVLWGTGFGPVTPAVPSGSTSSSVNGNTVSYATDPPSILIGGVPATVVAAGLNPSALGLYQIAVTIPASAPSGDQLIVATAGGKSSPIAGVFFTVQ
ncbi:MAG TPA: IPT/TIG domain-containing protein [Candidatus Limnocylindrales bacterium]|nr:IPT/TIG domain-containing protein [Candidatus Limnocylindrales bacterium]